MSADFYKEVDHILNLIKEAKDRNYPEHVLKYDLNNFLNRIYHEHKNEYDTELEWARDEAYDEGKEDGYSDGYDDGLENGKDEAHTSLVNKLVYEILKLKQWLLDANLSKKDISIKLTELLIAMDEKEDIPYTPLGVKLEEIDEIFNNN